MQRVKHNFDGYIRIFSFPITPSFQLTFRIAFVHLLNYFQLTFATFQRIARHLASCLFTGDMFLQATPF